MAWLNASIPVAAVIAGGEVMVKIGSTIAIVGIKAGCLIIIFTSLFVLVITVASVASEPVPAVVGIAMCGIGASAATFAIFI